MIAINMKHNGKDCVAVPLKTNQILFSPTSTLLNDLFILEINYFDILEPFPLELAAQLDQQLLHSNP